MWRLRPRLVAACLLVFGAVAAQAAARSSDGVGDARAEDPDKILLNDLRSPAGLLESGTLTVRLEAREGRWQPSGPDGPTLPVAAFAEAGRPLQNPGPLLRVPSGTDIRATVRNALTVPLTVYGLGEVRGLGADSVLIAPGAEHEFRFRAREPGVYWYAGRTAPAPDILFRLNEDSQLNGALVIDPPGASATPRDRLLMITGWATFDSTTRSGLGPHATLALNGAMWPHTERFDVAEGDSLYWRLINATFLPHPMHLHGFYFRLDARGDGATYSELPAEARRLAVTELLPPGGTMALAWSPDRPGNWIFHCHFASHMASDATLEQDRRHPETVIGAGAAGGDEGPGEASGGHGPRASGAHGPRASGAHGPRASGAHGPSATHTADGAVDSPHAMSGLVLGIRVAARGPRPEVTEEARAVRLLIRSRPNVWGDYAGYGFVLGGTAEEADPRAFRIPGPTLVLEKGRPVAVTLVNQSHEPAAVHWHGIELESFPDGVPGWSGQGNDLLPAIPPGDSLTIRFTPPRAGTFIYHSHMNELQQLGSGMYGALLVVEPGQRLDPDTDRVLLFSDDGPTIDLVNGPFPLPLLNGERRPGSLEFRAGVPHRLRLIGIGADAVVLVALLDGEHPTTWRLVAKDGADLPPAQAGLGPAELVLAAGETYDVEVAPERPGTWTLRFGVPPDVPGAAPPVEVPVRVR